MTDTGPLDAPAMRRAVRPADRRVVGGVASGLADHFDVPVLWVRIGFVVLTWLNGVGILAYLLLWRFMPLRAPESSPGLESATRSGLRVSARIGPREIAQTVAIGTVGLGVLVLLSMAGRGIGGNVLVPILLAVVGVALVWRQIDDAALGSWLRQTRGPGHLLRLLLGAGLVGIAAVFAVIEGSGSGPVLGLLVALLVAVIGLLLILGPWIVGLWIGLAEERRQRIRSQERADVAAHLHDSVLQTLALLQKNADDPATVATLARRQERELRDWLYGDQTEDGTTFVRALRDEVEDVEVTHRVAVEVVTVGDAPMNSDLLALVKAVREAMVNAAKHAGVPRVDVYAEVTATAVEVFVRDRGAGFDPAQVAEDRQGIRGSIVERIERHGGTASVRSSAGEGTEVALVMPRRATIEQEAT